MIFDVFRAVFMAEIDRESIPSSTVTDDCDMPKSVMQILCESVTNQCRIFRKNIICVELLIDALKKGDKKSISVIYRHLKDTGLDTPLFNGVIDISEIKNLDQLCHAALDELRKKLATGQKILNEIINNKGTVSDPKPADGPTAQFKTDHKYKELNVEKIPLSDLITIAQVKAEYGISEDFLRALQRTLIMPSPIADLDNRKYWIREDVETILSRYSNNKKAVI